MRAFIVAAVVVLVTGCLALMPAAESLADESWDEYRRRFVSADGRVIDTGNRNISHSEGQGWGMILAQAHADRETFDTIWNWTRANLGRSDVKLFSWRYDPAMKPPVGDPNNASDGDLFIAWALHLAAARWNEAAYATASEEIRRTIESTLVREFAGYQVLLPGLEGFVENDYVVVNLSYWFMPALRDFAELEPTGVWQKLIDDGRRLLGEASFGSYGLPADWTRLTTRGVVEPAPGWPPNFGFDAVRIPLYLVWGGFPNEKAVTAISSFWNASTPEQPAPAAWIDLNSGEQADYPASRGVLAVQALINRQPWRIPTAPEATDDYYSSSLLMLVRMAADLQQGAD